MDTKNNSSTIHVDNIRRNEVLYSLMVGKGLNQSKFAKDLGVNRSYINRILHFHEEAPITLKIKIAKNLGVDSRVIWP